MGLELLCADARPSDLRYDGVVQGGGAVQLGDRPGRIRAKPDPDKDKTDDDHDHDSHHGMANHDMHYDMCHVPTMIYTSMIVRHGHPDS